MQHDPGELRGGEFGHGGSGDGNLVARDVGFGPEAIEPRDAGEIGQLRGRFEIREKRGEI